MKKQLIYDVQTFFTPKGPDMDGAELVSHLDDLGWKFTRGLVASRPSMPLSTEKKLALEITIILAQMNAEFTVAGVDHLAGELIRKGWVHRTDAPLPIPEGAPPALGGEIDN